MKKARFFYILLVLASIAIYVYPLALYRYYFWINVVDGQVLESNIMSMKMLTSAAALLIALLAIPSVFRPTAGIGLTNQDETSYLNLKAVVFIAFAVLLMAYGVFYIVKLWSFQIVVPEFADGKLLGYIDLIIGNHKVTARELWYPYLLEIIPVAAGLASIKKKK